MHKEPIEILKPDIKLKTEKDFHREAVTYFLIFLAIK